MTELLAVAIAAALVAVLTCAAVVLSVMASRAFCRSLWAPRRAERSLYLINGDQRPGAIGGFILE